MKSFVYKIKAVLGIRTRPAGKIMKEANEFSSEIYIEKDGKKANIAKILSVLNMGIKKGDTVTVSAKGSDEDIAAERMKELFEETF